MKCFAVVLVAFALTCGSAKAQSIYAMRGVSHLLATAPGVTSSMIGDRRNYSIGENQPGGFVEPGDVDDGFLADGHEVLIVPLTSGGSGGIFTTLLWTRNGNGAWKFVGPLTSGAGHLSVYLQRGTIFIVRPIYRANDPNCCPSGHHYETATLKGLRIVTLDRWNLP